MWSADVSDEIVRQVPYLRRFARSVCASQQVGDAAVKRLLEVLVDDRSSLTESSSLGIGLYRALTRIMMQQLARLPSLPPGGPDDTSAGGQSVSRLSLGPRQAFVLTSLEGMAARDAAEVMGISVDALKSLLDTARAELQRHVGTDVLLIEDEMFIALELEALVTGLGHRVRAIASNKAEAVSAATRFVPGLVLADIQLADGSSGIEAANEILAGRPAPVIFITAYPERWLTGKRPGPAFLINKPFRPDAVRATIHQALFFGANRRKPECVAAAPEYVA